MPYPIRRKAALPTSIGQGPYRNKRTESEVIETQVQPAAPGKHKPLSCQDNHSGHQCHLGQIIHGAAIFRVQKFRIGFGFFFGFLSWYHLPYICNRLELESVILHGICYILAWLLCILHGICYVWPCLPSILHGICHVLALQPLICMVFATFWYFKRSCGFLESFFRLSFRVSCKVSYQDFLSGFSNVHVGFFRASWGFHLGFHWAFHLRFHLEFLLGFI